MNRPRLISHDEVEKGLDEALSDKPTRKPKISDEELDYLIPLLRSGKVTPIQTPPYHCPKCNTDTVTLFKFVNGEFQCSCETCQQRIN